jgi:hypothetical protein
VKSINYKYAASFLTAIGAFIVVGARLFLLLSIQFPAPVGDSIYFLSVSLYHCSEGVYATPLVNIDPTGRFRYIWHGIGQPAILSFFNPSCSNFGAHLALALIMVITFLISFHIIRKNSGIAVSLAFATTVFALQSKESFRPETTAILLCLVAEYLRKKNDSSLWIQLIILLAWLQPTIFIIYFAYVLLTNSTSQWHRVIKDAYAWIALAVVLNGLIAYAYPFGLNELIHGLLIQGASTTARNDGDIYTYFIKSNFFPLFGIFFCIAYLVQLSKFKSLIFLVPLIWYFGFRVPPTYYNITPLFVVLLFGALSTLSDEKQANIVIYSRRKIILLLITGTGGLGCVGLLQGDLRDTVSYLRNKSTLTASQLALTRLQNQGYVPCEVPIFFTLFMPLSDFDGSRFSTTKYCSRGTGQKINIKATSGASQIARGTGCTNWNEIGYQQLAGLFNSDSGYSFYYCKVEP